MTKTNEQKKVSDQPVDLSKQKESWPTLIVRRILLIFGVTYNTLRLEPDRVARPKDPNNDRLTNLIIIVFIFAVAFWFRFFVRMVFIGGYGEQYFHIRINDADTLGFGKFLGVAPGELVYAEGYNDYDFYYVDYVNAFDNGWNPYSGNVVPEDVLNGYVYGPFYIYLIAIGKMFFNLSAEESVIYSNIIFDSGTYVMVYVLAKRVTGNMIAMLIALVSSFSPIALFYANIRVLNAPQMTFFLLLFIFFFLEHRDILAGFFLAIATLTKQFPLFIAMPFGLWMVRRYGAFKGTAIFVIHLIFLLLLSIPWIIVSPVAYFTRLFLPGRGSQFITCPEGGVATTLVAGELDQESCGVFAQTKNPADIQITEFGVFLDSIISTHLLFFGSLVIFAWAGFTAYDYLEKNPKLYYRFFAAYFGLAHATIARGIYKYYLTLLIPLFILVFIPGNKEKSLNIRIGAFLKENFEKLKRKFRNMDWTAEFWVHTVFFGIMAISILWIIDATVSMFTNDMKYYVLWMVVISVLALLFVYKPNAHQSQHKENVVNDYQDQESGYVRYLGPLIIVIFSFGWFIRLLAKKYFGENTSSFRQYQYMFLLFSFAWLMLPLLPKLRQNRYDMKLSTRLIQFDTLQAISDFVYLAIAYWFFIFIQRELFLVDRYFTAAVVLAISIFILGMMGGEFWSTFFVVPYRAVYLYFQLIQQEIYLQSQRK